jgi:hypothetical protein
MLVFVLTPVLRRPTGGMLMDHVLTSLKMSATSSKREGALQRTWNGGLKLLVHRGCRRRRGAGYRGRQHLVPTWKGRLVGVWTQEGREQLAHTTTWALGGGTGRVLWEKRVCMQVCPRSRRACMNKGARRPGRVRMHTTVSCPCPSSFLLNLQA